METLVLKKKKNNAKTPVRLSGAEALIRCLVEEGADTLFGYPGGAIMPIYDALYDYGDRLNHILVRHEQGATHAAQGYARATGKTGICFATSGPGATNLITGIADAFLDSTPLLCITGQVISGLLGTDAFQETDVIGISKPVTKWNFQITRADEIAPTMARAFYIARSGRPGPVLLDVTKDAQLEECDFVYNKCRSIRSYKPVPVIEEVKLKEAATLINQAKKPFMVFGQGILLSGAKKELKLFIEKSGIPAGATLLGLSALDSDHPLHMGMLGMHGNYAPNVKTNDCDVLIAVGMRFDDRVTGNVKTYAKNAKVIHIEIDDAEIDKIIKTDVAIHADAKEALTKLLPLIKAKTYPEWVAEFEVCKKIEIEKIIRKDIYPESGKIRMGEVVNLISEITDDNAVIVSDVGQHQMVTERYYRYSTTNSNVTSGGLGTMGFALPASIGAKIGQPHRQVVAIIGDGGFQMTLQELGTIFQYKIPVKIIILNNNFLGMVRQWQQMFFTKRYSFTELVNPEFSKVAESFGITSQKISEREDLKAALNEMMEHEGPYLLDIIVEKEENVFPMVPSGASVSDIRLE